MFSLKWTVEADRHYSDLKQKASQQKENREKNQRTKPGKAEGLFKQVCKALNRLAQDPRHPGLRTHEYDSIEHPWSASEKVFEAYAQNQTPGAYRIFWCYGPQKQEITIISITPHP